jgi:hypothetical protein
MSHILVEIEKRIVHAKELLALEQRHLSRVQDRHLDDSFARFVVESRQRELEHLEVQRLNRIKLINAVNSAIDDDPLSPVDITLSTD